MRRALVLLVSALLLAAGLAVAAPTSPSTAAQVPAPLTGRLVDVTTGDTVGGMTVRLRRLTDGGTPGVVVDTDTTNSLGEFALNAGPTPQDEYFVQVVAGAYQGGYVGGSPRFAQPDVGNAQTFPPSGNIGTVRVNPAFIIGVVVNAANGRPVRNAKVTARSSTTPLQVEASDLTNFNGRFRLNGIEFEDDGFLKVNGLDVGFEMGFVACNKTVVPTFGEACASPLGVINGRIRLDRR